MIITSPSEIQDKLNVQNNTSSLSLRSAPPIHPALQYGVATSPASPPGYASTRKPLTSVTYSFWPQTMPPNSMILSPPDMLNPHPSYFISVNLNCFTPSSYITTVRRGSWDGDVIGDFEMGLTTSKKPSSVCIRGNERLLSDVLDTSYRPFRFTWTWKISDHAKATYLYWDDSAPAGALTCFSSKDKIPGNYLARFMPTTRLRKASRPAEVHRLEVSPQGHELFDDILLSALILERLRTTPSV